MSHMGFGTRIHLSLFYVGDSSLLNVASHVMLNGGVTKVILLT